VSRRAPPPPPEFFIDRSLGRHHLAAALTDCGLVVHTLASLYGEQKAQTVADEENSRAMARARSRYSLAWISISVSQGGFPTTRRLIPYCAGWWVAGEGT